MEQLLQAGENLEFFLEGSRSRSGKPCCPKAGLLSVVVDAVKEGEWGQGSAAIGRLSAGLVEDVLLVPVNICYDRIVERNFVKNELMVGSASGRGLMCVCVVSREERRDQRH